MTVEDLRHKLKKLKEEHRLLDMKISTLMESNQCDQLALQRLKKKKLQLKDEIIKLEDKLLPDIIA